MDKDIERGLRRAVGLSDLASLLAAGFSFPDKPLAEALAGGAFVDDWRASLTDACGSISADDEALAAFCAESFAAAEEGALRREYSQLFLAPGVNVPIWPYESPFLHVASGAAGSPSLMRTRISMDVERHMAEAGVVPADLRREPVDSVFHELEFLAHLHALDAEALRVGDEAGVKDAKARLAGFANEHVLKWMPAFMREVVELSRLREYRALAGLGGRYLHELGREVEADGLR